MIISSRRASKRLRQESGNMIVLAAISMVALFAFAALSIDLARFHQQQCELQSGTDSSALAGALLLTNSPQVAADIIQEATIVAQANKLGTNEVGTVEAGQWNTNSGTFSFSAGTTPYNAVRVPAQRSLPLTFGRVVGMNQMTPLARSVAMLTAASSAYGGGGGGLINFGVDQAQATNAFYSVYTITAADLFSTGNFGKLDLNLNDTWRNDIVSGCNCTVSIGDQVNTITGDGGCSPSGGIRDGFIARMNSNPIVIMPVIDSWPAGQSTTAAVVGFVGVEILAVTGNCGSGGNGWTLTVENVPVVLGGGRGGGGTTNAPYALARVLVQ